MKSLKKVDLRSFLLGGLVVLSASCAGDYRAPSSGNNNVVVPGTLTEKLAAAVGQAPEDIRPAKAPGLMEAKWGSNFAYITEDGRYVIFGDMLDLDTQEQVTEGNRRGDRLEALAELGSENTIEFAAKKPKYTVTVFTDIDCGYCRMLHRQIQQYNDEGITIRYVFFPRSGPDTDSFRKAQAVWCSDDRKAALTNAKATGEINGKSDCPNPVQRDWDLGVKIGVRGTPMLVLPNGESIPGYVPPEQLLARLSGAPDATAAGH